MTDHATPAPVPLVITRSRVVWTGDQLFDAGPDGRTHRIDGHSKLAPGPVETLLHALATCSGIDVISVLEKRRTPVERFRVEVAAHRRPEHPRRAMRLDLEYHIDGAGIDLEQTKRAARMSLEKYCTVAGSLGPDIVLTATIVLNGDAAPPFPVEIWSPGRG